MSIPEPPHQVARSSHDQFDTGGWFPSQEKADNYHNSTNEQYHKDRVRALKALAEIIIREEVANLRVADFGIGDAVELLDLGLKINFLIGVDTSPHMLQLAEANWKKKNMGGGWTVLSG